MEGMRRDAGRSTEIREYFPRPKHASFELMGGFLYGAAKLGRRSARGGEIGELGR